MRPRRRDNRAQSSDRTRTATGAATPPGAPEPDPPALAPKPPVDVWSGWEGPAAGGAGRGGAGWEAAGRRGLAGAGSPVAEAGAVSVWPTLEPIAGVAPVGAVAPLGGVAPVARIAPVAGAAAKTSVAKASPAHAGAACRPPAARCAHPAWPAGAGAGAAT